ncbi:hypothetical protein HDV05_002295, partial [Chytridiales sp. JEL 0842]
MSTTHLLPPEVFGIVEPTLYRSSTPDPTHYTYLRTLHLRTILLLSPEAPPRALLSFLEDSGIKIHHLGLNSWRGHQQGWKPVSEEMVKEGLQFVLNRENHPTMVMCTSGLHETGTFIGCLRKLQGWDFNSIVVEYRFYAANKSRYFNEQFIELFDLDLITLPRNLPTWMQDSLKLL